MTAATVVELPPRLEPVTRGPFLHGPDTASHEVARAPPMEPSPHQSGEARSLRGNAVSLHLVAAVGHVRRRMTSPRTRAVDSSESRRIYLHF
jgi:hypothetical protein